jgi:hypothetical protein
MRLNRSNSRPSTFVPRPSTSESGVALIVTVIMISVITFLTVAFLALSGRERNSVKTSTAQTTARLAADEATVRAQTEILAAIIATTNITSFDLLVSTNYIYNPGFISGRADPTNVNYNYANGNPLNPADALINVGNLLYSPRAPVYIETNAVTGASEFRYYLDLNRNRRHDPTGLKPVTNLLGTFYFPDGTTNPVFSPPNILSNYVTGDPEWIGGLNRPQQVHSASNRFQYRYAYIVVPEGKTLDVNFIHNQALMFKNGRTRMSATGVDFFRNQGVGTWEINLAAFLYDLNTNSTYGWGLGNGGYEYNPLTLSAASGVAFSDAFGIYRHRLNGPFNPAFGAGNLAYNFRSFGAIHGATAATLFQNDQVDGYSDGPLMVTNSYFPEIFPANKDNTRTEWLGDDTQYHLFSSQDFYNTKINRTGGGTKFTDRLAAAATNISTYDQNTFYRMISQLGSSSATEEDDRLNLNYVNIGGLKVTNFIAWTDSTAISANIQASLATVPPSVLFFTNTVDRLLKAYTADWLAADFQNYTNTFKTDKAFGIGNIPVYVNTQMVYSAVTHRILQVAANIWDAKANRRDQYGDYPTVFRPIFTRSNNNVYISTFVDEPTLTTLRAATLNRPVLDLYAVTNSAVVPSDGNVLIYGVPLVIGARKYQPNFNEFGFETSFQLTRKAQVRKATSSGPVIATNQFFTLSASMPFAAEFWNAYATNYARPVDIFVTNVITFVLTNDIDGNGIPDVNQRIPFLAGSSISVTATGTNVWRAYAENKNYQSFVVPLYTNMTLFSERSYKPTGTSFFSINQTPYDLNDPNLLAPSWGMTVTNRIQAMVIDRATSRIIDFVLLGNLTSHRNLSAEFSVATTGTGDPFALLWATNQVGSAVSGRIGVVQQVNISRGDAAGVAIDQNNWKPYGNFDVAGYNSVTAAAEGFNRFMTSDTGKTVQPVPFSPTINFAVPMNWQANDPIVHYLSSELFNLAESEQIKKLIPGTTQSNLLSNIGKKNNRYQPWGHSETETDPDSYNPSLKDPLVRSADAWEFPTNVFPTVGWLGRIHRGTPWQTVYLKASNVGLTNIVNSPNEWVNNAVYRPAAEKWANWTGNKTLEEGFYSRPVTDRVLFDVFTTALNDNSTRGQLPINQTNLAAWSAVFSGVIALTNNSTEAALLNGLPGQFAPLVIQPAGLYDPFNTNTWSPLVKIVDGINRTRANKDFFQSLTFNHLGDILAVPELTDASPFLNLTPGSFAVQRGMNDSVYEWLPQQVMSLLQVGKPRFAIYSYGQALQPAPDSVVTAGGQFFGLCTNYAITAEQVTRTVIEIEGGAKAPRVVVKSFNILGPE